MNMIQRGVARGYQNIQDSYFPVLKNGTMPGFFVYRYLCLQHTDLTYQNKNE